MLHNVPTILHAQKTGSILDLWRNKAWRHPVSVEFRLQYP